MISSILSIASGFSILAIIGIFSSDFFSIISLKFCISLAFLTNDNATQSTSFEIAKNKSFLSFSVREGVDIFVFGRLIPFLDEMMPP